MEQIATSLTSHMRNTADPAWVISQAMLCRLQPSSKPASSGLSSQWHYCFSPVVSMATTIIMCARQSVPIRKSSSLATLLHGLDKGSCQEVTDERLSGMEGNAKGWAMKVRRHERRWVLEGGLHRKEWS